LRGSLFISFLSVITSGVVGVFLAVLLNRWDFRFRKLYQALVLVPIALPPLMGVKAFYLLYGKAGTFPQLLGQIFHVSPTSFALTGISGVLLVHTLTMYPYFYLSVAASLAQADDSLEEAASSLGATSFQTWRRVLLPMLTPPIVAGALLTFMSSMASYTAPLLFEVNNVMTVQIANNAANRQALASAVAVMLAVISVFFLIVIRAYEQRRVYRTQSKGGARKRRRLTSPVAKLVLFISALVSTIILILPIAMIFLLAFSVNYSWRTAPLPSAYTTANFVKMFSDSNTFDPIRNSLEMSAIAVAGALILGVTCAYVTSRMRVRGKGIIDVAMMLPWALPGTVVAFNLIVAFARPSVFSLGQVLIGTYWIVPLAYFVRFSPLIFRSTTSAMTQLDPSLEEAARTLGSTWWGAFRRVVLPLTSSGIAGGVLLAFVAGVGEFVATIMLFPKLKYRPLSIAINDELNVGRWGTAACLGVVQVVLVLTVVIIMRRVEDRSTITHTS
ncbi:MAG TPA: iron ABC transporter permease, partial [Terriglobia bacterium]|nr:iron ABC transporter permease [Terriglobia bacterium]